MIVQAKCALRYTRLALVSLLYWWLPACSSASAITDECFPTAEGEATYRCCAKGQHPEVDCGASCRKEQDCGYPMNQGGAVGEGSGGAGGSGGGDAVPTAECSIDTDCLQPQDAACGQGRCIDGVCEIVITHGPIASQLRADCSRWDCDLTGKLVKLDDPSDVYDDGNVCTEDICVDGVWTNKLRPDGSYCTEPGSGYCFQGSCVECIAGMEFTTCPGMACDGLYCVTAQCAIDQMCGKDCAPCVYGASCTDDKDCLDGVCAGTMCAAAACDDTVRNDGETDVDCGGPCDAKCADEKGCAVHDDCQSGVCWVGECQKPTCTDGTWNGDEKDIDCGSGAPGCPACL